MGFVVSHRALKKTSRVTNPSRPLQNAEYTVTSSSYTQTHIPVPNIHIPMLTTNT